MPAVFAIESYGIARQEPLHSRGDRHLTRANQQVDMIGDQRPRKALGLRFDNDGGKPFNKIRAIGIRSKNLPALDPSHNDVIHRPRCLDSGSPQRD